MSVMCVICLTRLQTQPARRPSYASPHVRFWRTDLCTDCRVRSLPTDEPYYCTCATSDYDAIDQCRRCLRADARAPRVAAAIARVAARRQEVA